MAGEPNISAQLVKQLREKTGAGFVDCKKALEEAGGNLEQAEVVLRKRGMASAQKKAGRATAEGSVGSYIHAGGKIGVLVEVNCESDFVARTDDFKQLVHDLAMHVAAADPRYIDRKDIPAPVLEREREIARDKANASGKPPAVIEKIVEGQINKYYEEYCLLDQHFIKDPNMSIQQLVASKILKLGENIVIRRFARFKVGENAAGQVGPGEPAAADSIQ